MGIEVIFVLVFVLALPVAWFISEFKSKRRSVRCVLGILAILSCFGVAWLTAQFVRLNYNAWYGFSSKQLVDSIVERLENCDTQTVLVELKDFQKKYRPTYENRAHYDELVDEYVKKLEYSDKTNKNDSKNNDSSGIPSD